MSSGATTIETSITVSTYSHRGIQPGWAGVQERSRSRSCMRTVAPCSGEISRLATLSNTVALVTWVKRRPLTLTRVAAIGVPFAAPALTLGFAAVVRAFSGLVELPVNEGAAFLGQNYLFAPAASFTWGINRVGQEDIAGFGPIGGLMLIAVSAGTPAEPGMPSVATPLPAFTSIASEWPW